MKQNRPHLNHDSCSELRDLLPAYIIGATTQDEAQLVQRLLPECPDAAKELEAYAKITVGLTQQIDPVVPPASLKSKLLAQASTPDIVQKDKSPPIGYPKFGWGIAATLILVLLASNIFLLTQLGSTNSRLDLLQASNEQITNLLTNQQLEQIALESTGEEDNVLLATLLWDAKENEVVLVSDQLPPLDMTQTYQLWLIDGTTPVSAGLFQPNAQHRALLSVEIDTQLAQYQAVAISIEPSLGSTAPTTNPIALGEIST